MKKTLFGICTLVLLSACTHKDLFDYRTDTVETKVVFDWKNAPDADPQTMSLYLFPPDGGSSLRYEFPSRDGGTIKVPSGSYKALCLNSDTEALLYRNTDRYDTFEIYTRETSLWATLGIRSENMPRTDDTGDERVALAPDMVWSDRAEHIVFDRNSEGQTITFSPSESVSTFSVEIRNAENLKYVTALSGAVTGLAGGKFLGKDSLSAECVTVPFIVSLDGLSALSGRFLSFGHCPATDNVHKLTIYAVLADGSKWYYTYDVTEQIHAAENPRQVRIILDGLPLPEPITNGGGFQPGIDEWQHINVDIDM